MPHFRGLSNYVASQAGAKPSTAESLELDLAFVSAALRIQGLGFWDL